MDSDDRWVELGRVCGVHGVAGWIKVYSYTQPPEGIFNYDPWYLTGEDCQQHRQVSLQARRRQGKSLLAKIEGCGDRAHAVGLIDRGICVRRSDLPSVGADEYYWSDLIGLRVVSADGAPLGVIDHMLYTGANDVMVVQGERERLIPYLPGRVIRRVDIESGTIQVDWDVDF